MEEENPEIPDNLSLNSSEEATLSPSTERSWSSRSSQASAVSNFSEKFKKEFNRYVQFEASSDDEDDENVDMDIDPPMPDAENDVVELDVAENDVAQQIPEDIIDQYHEIPDIEAPVQIPTTIARVVNEKLHRVIGIEDQKQVFWSLLTEIQQQNGDNSFVLGSLINLSHDINS